MTHQFNIEIIRDAGKWRLMKRSDNPDVNNEEECRVISAAVEFTEYWQDEDRQWHESFLACDSDFNWDTDSYSEMENKLIEEYLYSDAGHKEIRNLLRQEEKEIKRYLSEV